MPQSSCFRTIQSCVAACRAADDGVDVGLCIADCEVDLLACLREETGVTNADALVSFGLSGLLLPFAQSALPVAELALAADPLALSTTPVLTPTTDPAADAGFERVWNRLKRGAEMKGSIETALLLVPTITGLGSLAWDLFARRFLDRGEKPPQPECPQCGAGEAYALIGGHVDVLTVVLVAAPAALGLILLLHAELRSSMLRGWIGRIVLFIALVMTVVGFARGVLIGFQEPYDWVL